MTQILLSALGYIALTFPLAYVWHLGPLKEAYRAFGYFDGEPNIPLGFATIVIQAVIVAVMFPYFRPDHAVLPRILQFVVLIGVFHWSLRVLAMLAKQNVPNAGQFLILESLFIAFQFGLLALVLYGLYRNSGSS